MSQSTITELTHVRATRPEAIAEAAARRGRRPLLNDSGRLMIIAADHPARGALGAGADTLAMANRADMLERLCTALERPGVDGVLGTPDVLEDLLLLGALENKLAIGSMNRGGLAGASFELDDRFTGHRAEDIRRLRLDGGKLLLRIAPEDAGSLNTMTGAAQAVNQLAEQGSMAMVEPFVSRWENGKVRNDLSVEAVTRSVAIASGIGGTSAHTWLKVPVPADTERINEVMEATTLPVVLLGGDVAADPSATYERWHKALQLPNVYGLVVGRTLLYPPDGDVTAAVDQAVGLL